MLNRSTVLVGVVAAFVLGAFAATTFGASPAPAVRDPLAAYDNPVGAKGKTLGLMKVTIPAGTQLGLHRHPGTQVAYVARGVLTYTVRSGSVSVMHGPAGMQTLVRKISSGQTGRISAGDWLVEQPTTIHRAGNNSKTPVVVYLATLFPIGAPPAIPVQ